MFGICYIFLSKTLSLNKFIYYACLSNCKMRSFLLIKPASAFSYLTKLFFSLVKSVSVEFFLSIQNKTILIIHFAEIPRIWPDYLCALEVQCTLLMLYFSSSSLVLFVTVKVLVRGKWRNATVLSHTNRYGDWVLKEQVNYFFGF